MVMSSITSNFHRPYQLSRALRCRHLSHPDEASPAKQGRLLCKFQILHLERVTLTPFQPLTDFGHSKKITMIQDQKETKGNVLLLRDAMNLYPDTFEVSQEELLNLVASALIESNTRIYDDKRVSDAMVLLPRFAKGIDVDIKFTSIYGFEFTRELATFDLLDIPLCHGWIVDPEDEETATAIGSKSYNALMTEPVVLKTPSGQSSRKFSVDFTASAEHRRFGKGDTEEEIALLRALRLSEREALDTHSDSSSEGKSVSKDDTLVTSVDAAAGCTCTTLGSNIGEEMSLTTPITKSSEAHDHDQLPSAELEDENSSKMTAVHLTSSETNLESTKNDDSISEIPLKSEAVTFVNPDLSGRSQNDDVQSLDSPVYEGESLVGQSSSEKKDTNGLTPEEGELIRKFLKDNASQLTWSGLFYLQKGVKEGVLCVLFRNNHFYTMLKHEKELYTLVTDEGYQMQQDLVWEKLNEVNGDSVFFTGNFEVFKSDSGKSRKWDQQDAISETEAFISDINSSSSNEGIDINPDLQIAIEWQQRYWAGDSDSEVPIIRSPLVH